MFASSLVLASFANLWQTQPKSIWPGFGVNIHFTAPKPGEMELIGKAGFQYVRTDFAWSETERQPGQYDFSAYDSLFNNCRSKGIRPLFILDYSNELYQSNSPSSQLAREAFAKWAGNAVEHFRGKEILWEIWNEPNLAQFWKPLPSPADYAALALESARAMRAADPDCRIIAPGVSGIDMKFLSAVLTPELLGLIDGISVHPYRSGGPESVWDEIGQLRGYIREVAPEGRKNLPVISSEWGYSTGKGEMSEGRQAMYLSRMWLLNAAAGVPVSIFYDWKDDGPDPANREHRFGLVRENLDPKPSYIAAKELIAKFKGCSVFRRVPQTDPLSWVIIGAGANRLVQAKWYQKEAGVAYSELPLATKTNKSLYSSMLNTAATPAQLPVVSFAAFNISFAPPIDQDGWCVLVEKMISQDAKMEFRYQRASNGANVTCYTTVSAPRTIEALATLEPKTTLTAGLAGKNDRPRRVEQIAFQPSEWGVINFSENQPQPLQPIQTGSKGMRLDYKFPTGWQFLIVAPKESAPIPEGAKKLTLWIRPDGSGNALRSRFTDQSGQTFQVELGPLDSQTDRNGWRVVTIPLDGSGGGSFWGGSGSGKPAGKLTWEALLLVDSINKSNPRGGTIEIGPAAYEF